MSHSFQGFHPLSRHLCWELRGFYSFNFRLFLLVLYRTYHFWELTNEVAYPSGMRYFLWLSTRLFPIRSWGKICGVRFTE